MENVEKVFEKVKNSTNAVKEDGKEMEDTTVAAATIKEDTTVPAATVSPADTTVPDMKSTKSIADLENELGITMKIVEHIDRTDGENRYNIVIDSDALDKPIRYKKITDIKNAPRDLMNEGIMVDTKVLSELIKALSSQVSQNVSGRLHKKIGWDVYNGQEIFKYREVASQNNNLESYYDGDLDLSYSGDLKTYVKGIKKLVVPSNKLMIVYLAGASGIVTQQLKLPDLSIMLNVCGESGCGKTTAENVAMSFWGNPMKLSTSFNSTENGLEQIMGERCIMPVLIDDILAGSIFSSERTKQEAIQKHIFKHSGGRTKDRFNSKGTEFYCGTLVSSESSLLEKLVCSESKGQFSRMIEIHVKKGELTLNAKHARDLNQLFSSNYGLGAMELGQYMVKNGYTREKLNSMYMDVQSRLLCKKCLESNQRAANRLAIMMITAELMDNCFNLGLDIQGIEDELINSVNEAMELADLNKKKYYDLLKVVKDYPELFVDNKKSYTRREHLGVYTTNALGSHSLIVETDRMAMLIRGAKPKQIMLHNGGEKVKNMPDSTVNKILVDWRARGWLNSCGSDQRCYKRLTFGDTSKQKMVYEIIYSE